ncbi:succinylglutamate desuccinylase [Vibrio gangliei]|uniref:succinylglutamate desuccinylase n=1 Tax=Vibrio gangliei TaxID=2077090 RepID=UPI000D0218BA|nr:succinylglutamate desuccinylase [Vibrio gangliei]
MTHQHYQSENPLLQELLDKGLIYTSLHHLTWPQQTLTLDNGLIVRFYYRGMLSISPQKYAKESGATVISVGIHGDETGPIELVDRLVDQVLHGKVTLSHPCLFIFAHPDATAKKVRFIEHNLNQMFEMSSMPVQGLESMIAAKIKDVVELFYERAAPQNRWHLDLHCSSQPSQYPVFAIRPATRHLSHSDDEQLMAFARQADIQAFLQCQQPNFTFSWFTGEYCQAKSLTIELGQLRALGENDLSEFHEFSSGVESLLARSLVPNFGENRKQPMAIYNVVEELRKQSDDLVFTATQALINFEPLYFNQEYAIQNGLPLICESGRHALVFANPDVEIGQRAALLVERIS